MGFERLLGSTREGSSGGAKILRKEPGKLRGKPESKKVKRRSRSKEKKGELKKGGANRVKVKGAGKLQGPGSCADNELNKTRIRADQSNWKGTGDKRKDFRLGS